MLFDRLPNIYYEADDGAGGGATPTDPPKESYTKAEVDELLKGYKTQAEIDKIVKERVARATEKKALEIEEAQKLAKMSESDKQAAELKKLQDRVSQYENEKLVLQFKTELASKKLPAEIANFISVTDAENASKALAAFEKMFTAAVTEKDAKIKELEEQLKNANLRGVTPKAVTGGNKTAPSIPTIF